MVKPQQRKINTEQEKENKPKSGTPFDTRDDSGDDNNDDSLCTCTMVQQWPMARRARFVAVKQRPQIEKDKTDSPFQNPKSHKSHTRITGDPKTTKQEIITLDVYCSSELSKSRVS